MHEFICSFGYLCFVFYFEVTLLWRVCGSYPVIVSFSVLCSNVCTTTVFCKPVPVYHWPMYYEVVAVWQRQWLWWCSWGWTKLWWEELQYVFLWFLHWNIINVGVLLVIQPTMFQVGKPIWSRTLCMLSRQFCDLQKFICHWCIYSLHSLL